MTPEKQDKTLQLSKHWSAISILEPHHTLLNINYSVANNVIHEIVIDTRPTG